VATPNDVRTHKIFPDGDRYTEGDKDNLTNFKAQPGELHTVAERSADARIAQAPICRTTCPYILDADRVADCAFTLVELLVVLVIIGVLGSIVMFAMFGAQESAREAKTKNVISKLNLWSCRDTSRT
jgi:prepilin-type N-terminal cleavage/methylation domain-containing protein